MNAFGCVADLIRELDFNKPVIALSPQRSALAARQFVENFPGNALFAIKANNRPELVETIYNEGIHTFDVASLNEVKQASKYKDAELYFMNPVKSRHDIAHAYHTYGVRRFVLDTEDELHKILEETDNACDLILFVRISVPNDAAVVPLEGKFGTTPQNGTKLLQLAAKSADKLGLSFHVGSQTVHPQAFVHAAKVAADVIHSSKVHVEYLNVGGGFPVQYAGAKTTDLNDFFTQISKAIESVNWQHRPELLCEPGRSLVAEAETLYVKVIGRKGKMLFINDGAFGTLFEGSQMYYGLTYPARRVLHMGQPVLNEPDGTESFCLQGPSCDSADTMPGPYYLPANMREGDVLELRNIGAYGHVMASPFNGFGKFELVTLNDDICEQSARSKNQT